MNCFTEEQVIHLFDRGLESAREEERTHLDACAACRDSWATVAAAGELLTQARPTAPRKWRLFPVMVAAGMLLAIIGVIATRPPVRKPIVQDPVTLFMEGSPEESKRGRAALLQGGRKSMIGLLAARPRFKCSSRFKDLQNLLFEIKFEGVQDPILEKVQSMRIDLGFENTRMSDVIGFMCDFTKLNIVLDPMIDGGMLEVLSLKDATLREALELMCAVKELDFDLRYGVVFVSTPLRMWSLDPKVGLPAANEWATRTPDGEIADRLRKVRATLDMQNAMLTDVCGSVAEISAVPLRMDPAPFEQAVTLKATDLLMVHILELMTLPYGFDVRIENGAAVIFVRK